MQLHASYSERYLRNAQNAPVYKWIQQFYNLCVPIKYPYTKCQKNQTICDWVTSI